MRYFSIVAVVSIIGGLILMSLLNSKTHLRTTSAIISNDVTKQVIEKINLSFKRIPAGSFIMGNRFNNGESPEQKPTRTVTVKAFKMMKHEVTFEQYDQFTSLLGLPQANDAGWGRGHRPVINVSWKDAAAYAAWLSSLTDKIYRLPTEAEWEYACRSNNPLNVYCGKYDINQIAWYGNNSQGTSQRIGSKLPNEMGLYDMSGNVAEFVQDCWNFSHRYAPNTAIARNSGDCGKAVVKGGSWKNGASLLTAAYRTWSSAEQKYNHVGLRLVEEIL